MVRDACEVVEISRYCEQNCICVLSGKDRRWGEYGSGKLELGSRNAAFDKLRRDKGGNNRRWEVGKNRQSAEGMAHSGKDRGVRSWAGRQRHMAMVYGVILVSCAPYPIPYTFSSCLLPFTFNLLPFSFYLSFSNQSTQSTKFNIHSRHW